MPLLTMPTNGTAIRHHRQLAGWNLRPFARHVGISHGYLSRLERDETDATPAMLKRIADALNLTVRDLSRDPTRPDEPLDAASVA